MGLLRTEPKAINARTQRSCDLLSSGATQGYQTPQLCWERLPVSLLPSLLLLVSPGGDAGFETWEQGRQEGCPDAKTARGADAQHNQQPTNGSINRDHSQWSGLSINNLMGYFSYVMPSVTCIPLLPCAILPSVTRTPAELVSKQMVPGGPRSNRGGTAPS